MSFILYFVYLVITFLSVLYLYFKYQYTYWKSRGVPHLEPKIPLGNLTSTQHFVHLTIDAYKLKTTNHRFVGAYLFSKPTAIPTDLDLIKDILKKDFEYFPNRGMYFNERDDPLSANLLTLEGEKWKNLRAKLTPTFTTGKMKFMFSTIVDVGNEFRQILSEMLQTENGAEIEVKELITRFTTDVIGTCAFGIDCNSLRDPNAEFLRMGQLAFAESPLSLLRRLFQSQFRDLAQNLRTKWFRPDITKFFMNVVRETVAYREKNNVRRNDFMDILIELKNGKFEYENVGKLTMDEIAAQAFLFFLAGFETSASTMTFCLYELALNPELQSKARNEINLVLKKYNGNFTYEAMMEMTYIDQIISETLRMYPPIPIILRTTLKDYQVPDTNQIIPKGISVMIPVFALQHDPEIYAEPNKFDPERFNPENIKTRHACSFLSFGDGLRNCIGSRFGRMQTRIGLACLLQNFKFEKCNKTEIPFKFSRQNPMLTAENGIWLKISNL